MKRAISLLVLLTLLQSCASSKQIVGPDGSHHQLVSCPSIDMCYEKATEVCGGKYKIVNTSTETSGSQGYTSTDTKLLVKCSK
ncbi:MAG: hypothetical protein HN509_07350 [Halobacteriovoraceae bacterium]|jgi:hypothetical protein|nr:hypothetical protein [Halobacteriovoraceae bacterium]